MIDAMQQAKSLKIVVVPYKIISKRKLTTNNNVIEKNNFFLFLSKN